MPGQPAYSRDGAATNRDKQRGDASTAGTRGNLDCPAGTIRAKCSRLKPDLLGSYFTARALQFYGNPPRATARGILGSPPPRLLCSLLYSSAPHKRAARRAARASELVYLSIIPRCCIPASDTPIGRSQEAHDRKLPCLPSLLPYLLYETRPLYSNRPQRWRMGLTFLPIDRSVGVWG